MAHINDRRAASSKRLQEIKDVTPQIAAQVRKVWKTVTNRKDARDQIDKLIETYGVEFLGVHRSTGYDVYYCNAGDTYATTILFHGLNMTVGCWGDLVEGNRIREARYSD
jgi:hypothetical protein